MSVYIENGYKSRADYLQSLAEDYDIPLDVVMIHADILGETEDFDGLVTHLQDISDNY